MPSTAGLLACVAASLLAAGCRADCGKADPSHPPSLRIAGGEVTGLAQGISGGNEAAEHSYPWMVSVNGNCGGALINDQWVVTAAHCVAQRSGAAIAASHRVFVGGHTSQGGQMLWVEKVLPHEQYRGACNGRGYDIALLKVPKVEFSDKVQPVCLPSKSDSYVNNAGVTLVATGWGYNVPTGNNNNDRLQQVALDTETESCARDWAAHNFLNPNTEFCAWGGSGKATCGGDSGGPLVHYKDGRFQLAGAVSCGDPSKHCSEELRPGYFTHIPSHVDWINDKVANN